MITGKPLIDLPTKFYCTRFLGRRNNLLDSAGPYRYNRYIRQGQEMMNCALCHLLTKWQTVFSDNIGFFLLGIVL